MKSFRTCTAVLSSTLLAAACGKGQETPATPPAVDAAATVAPAPTPAPAPAPATPKVDPDPAADVAPAEPAPAPTPDDGGEKDPSATDTVTATTLEGDDVDTQRLGLPGYLVGHVAWRDKHGTSAVFLTREVPKGAGAELFATHMNREGDGSWTKVRDFRELVSNCNDWRLTLEAKTGAWSVTDVDADGLGEATFAWSAGCRTDWSPVTHKVLVVESGEKYVLRGQTGAATFEADAAFDKVPSVFREHATKVWGLTATEKPPEKADYQEEPEWNGKFLQWDRLGPLPIGAQKKWVEELFGKAESKDPIFHDESASGQYFETWKYPSRGLELTMTSEDAKMADATLSSLTITGPSDLKTRLGIGIGSTEADLKTAYDRFRNTETSREGWLAIGIEWLWLTFETKDGKVVSIRAGLGAEPPSAE
jgi:hypothetical protein